MTNRRWRDTRGEVEALRNAARSAEQGPNTRAAIAALEELAEHPCAHHEVDLPEVWSEIAWHHRRLEEHDAAIEATQRAIEVGHRCRPLPERDLAELHLLARRREECDRLYAEVRDRTPQDVWLYNHAGWAYLDVGLHDEALRWLTEGVELAMHTGDPEGIVSQLADARHSALDAAGIDRIRIH